MDLNTSFDKMANDVILLVPKKDKLEAREIFFNYKKLHPHLFVADVEQFEKEQEALYEKLAAEEDGKRDRDCKYNFKKLLESMVVEDNPEIINMNPQSCTELFGTIKGLQKSSKINTKRSIIDILQIATLIQQSKITYKRKYAHLLKEIGYSKSYGSFMIRFLKLVERYPDLRNITTTISFIYHNIQINEDNIHNFFSPALTTNN